MPLHEIRHGVVSSGQLRSSEAEEMCMNLTLIIGNCAFHDIFRMLVSVHFFCELS